jgi:hypothetical protein
VFCTFSASQFFAAAQTLLQEHLRGHRCSCNGGNAWAQRLSSCHALATTAVQDHRLPVSPLQQNPGQTKFKAPCSIITNKSSASTALIAALQDHQLQQQAVLMWLTDRPHPPAVALLVLLLTHSCYGGSTSSQELSMPGISLGTRCMYAFSTVCKPGPAFFGTSIARPHLHAVHNVCEDVMGSQSPANSQTPRSCSVNVRQCQDPNPATAGSSTSTYHWKSTDHDKWCQ